MHRQTQAVKSLIHNAAASGSTVSYTALFAIFPKNTVPGYVYRILEEACFELGNWDEVIYSVVMATKGTNLPGDGFFDIFKNHRNLEYLQIAGRSNIQNLSLEQKIKMVTLEKVRVYAHAKY